MDQFKFEALTIEKLIAHTINARAKDKSLVPPIKSDKTITLDGDAKDLIQIRITEALGSASHGIEIHAAKTDSSSFMQKSASALRGSDDDFIAASKQLADDLAAAQTNPKWPGGVLIVLRGKVGNSQKPYIAAIKAETDKGFNIVEEKGSVGLRLIKKMLLSQTQRLYKIGLTVETNYEAPEDGLYKKDNYRHFLFDHLLTKTETKSAAAYFYDAFLGMNIIKSSKFQTKTFYEGTKNFISNLPISQPERYELLEALRSELRSNKGTLSITVFADDHLPSSSKDEYIVTMTNAGLPDSDIVKDTDYIKAKLRRPRRVDFSTGIRIQIPAELTLSDSVKIGTISDGFTEVKIKGAVEGGE